MNKQQPDIQLISQLLTERITHISPILNKGEVNRVYRVKTENNQIVIRLNEENEIGRFKKEQWCIEQARKHGISSPQVIDLGIKDDIAFMVLNFVNGFNGEEITQNKSYIWKKLGAYARKIHSIKTVGFGETMTQPGKFNDFWERYVRYNVESLNDKDELLSMNIINRSYSAKLRVLFKELLEKQFSFGLSHNDLSLANTIIEDDNITLIDWGSAESTVVPHFEIIGILEDSLQEENSLFKDFLDGYGMSLGEFENMKHDMVSLTLLRALDKLRWAIDRKPEKIEDFSTKVTKLVSQYL